MRLEIYCLVHEIPYRTVPYGTGAEFGWDFVRAWYPRIGSYGRTVYRAVPVHLDEDGCPLEVQPFPHPTLLLRKLAPLWEHGFHNWPQIICRGPDGRPNFMDGGELQ